MRKLLLTLAATLLGAASATAQGIPFDECGTLIPGVTCPLFLQTPSGVYLLDNYGNFQVGDTVSVQGLLDTGCITICIQGSGCISNTIIGPCNPGNSATAYCFGDGSGTACPCGNSAGSDEGCANSSGAGGTLAASGSDSIASDDLAFSAGGLLPNQPALLFSGSVATNGGSGLIFGDGLRCAGGQVLRHSTQSPDANGDATWPTGLAAQAGWNAGDTRNFQAWYRDPLAGPCGGGFNLTHGVSVTFSP